MRNPRSFTLFVLLSLFALVGLTACRSEGPLEEAGRKIDRVADDIGDSIEDAFDD